MDKAPDAFRTISEVAADLELPQHVLRFWETRFSQIRPMKRSGGRRYYRPDDVELLKGIRHLLYGEGYTIRGVQRILKEQGIKAVQALAQGGASDGRPSPSFADSRSMRDESDEADANLSDAEAVEDEDLDEDFDITAADVQDGEDIDAGDELDEDDAAEDEAGPVTAAPAPRSEPVFSPHVPEPPVPRSLQPSPAAIARPPASVAPSAPRLRDDEREALQGALETLIACREALDAAMREPADSA